MNTTIKNISKHIILFTLSMLLIVNFFKQTQINLTLTVNAKQTTSNSAKKTKNKKNSKLKKYNPYDKIKLSPIRCINSRSYKISFESSKILLKKEVCKSYIYLEKNKKKLKASFHSLTNDGRKITYLLNKKSIRTLNPGDGSMNGKFNVSFSFCKFKTIVMYTEKIIKNSITGFILSSEGTPVSSASVSLKAGSSRKVSCKSDSNGQYILPAPENTTGDITVQKNGYTKQTLNDVTTSKDGAICQNFILNKNGNYPLTTIFHITDIYDQIIPNATIEIADDNSSIAQFQTDQYGNTIISNTKQPDFNLPLTTITLSKNSKDINYNNSCPNNWNSDISKLEFNKEQTYTISISKNTSENKIIYDCLQFKFSFNDISSNNILFNISLGDAKPFSLNSNLSIKWDSDELKLQTSNLEIELYDLNTITPNSSPVLKYNCLFSDDLKQVDTINFNQLVTLSETENISLVSDGIYYLRIQALSNDNTYVGSTCLIPINVKDGTIDNVTATIKNSYSKEFIAVINWPDSPDNNSFNEFISDLSFYLYEKKGSLIIPVAPIHIADCTFKCKENTSYGIASVKLTNLSKNSDYVIYPYSTDSKLTISSPKEFKTDNNNQDIQIKCIASNSINNTDIFSDIYQQNSNLLTNLSSIISLDNHVIRSATNYPNSVLCFYNNDDKITSLCFINTSLIGYFNFSKLPFDIYTNSRLINIT